MTVDEVEGTDVVVGDEAGGAETAETLPAPVADEVLDGVVGQINELVRTNTLDMALNVGRIIIEQFYGGDLDGWRTRGTKDASFRKLAERQDLHLSAAGLYRAVSVYQVCQRLGISDVKHLGVSHYYAVLGLPEARQQELLLAAEAQGWTAEELQRQVRAARDAGEASRRGRPPLPAFVKTVTRLRKVVEMGDEAFGDLDRMDDLDLDLLQQLQQTVAEVKRRCAELEAALKRRTKGG